MLKIKERMMPRLTEYVCRSCYAECYLPTTIGRGTVNCPICLHPSTANGDMVVTYIQDDPPMEFKEPPPPFKKETDEAEMIPPIYGTTQD